MTGPGARRRRVVAAAAIAALVSGLGAGVAVRRHAPPVAARPGPSLSRQPGTLQPGTPRPGTPSAGMAQARPAPLEQPDRTGAVQALLAERSRAVLTRDRAAFLAGIDPRATDFAARQAALFDALAQVPVRAWQYTLHDADAQPDDPVLDQRYGTWWAPRVVLGVALDGVDVDPAESEQALTFVRRDGRWYVAADDDFASRGARTAREIWDGGPVVVVRGARTLVLGHPASLPQMRQLAADVDAAVPRVTAVWGTGWTQEVAVVVPADQAELATLVTARGSLTPIAALAVAGPVRGGTARAGDRVLVNPVNLAKLGTLGRRIVLTHEVTHIASRAATGPDTPTWLSEGLADHVGYLGAGVPVRTAAAELSDEVRRGQVPAALPTADAWSGDNPDLSAVYEQAWLMVELIVANHGQDQLLRVYRDLGVRTDPDPQVALAAVVSSDLGTTVAQLTAAWQDALRRQLS